MKDMKGVTYVCDYILDGKLDGSHGSKEEFPKNMRCILDYLVCSNSDLVSLYERNVAAKQRRKLNLKSKERRSS